MREIIRAKRQKNQGTRFLDGEINRYARGATPKTKDGGVKWRMDEDLVYEILSVVAEIPEGSVATYGQIARLIGRDKNSRLVGKVLGMSQYYGRYPCHRVVNHAGRLAPGWAEQQGLLQSEGVTVREDGRVELKRYQWDC